MAQQEVVSSAGVDIIPVSPATAKLRLPKPDDSKIAEAIYLSPDKSELVRLDKEAASVIIGNPQHLTALAEDKKTLVLIPRLPGATYFTVLDKDTNIIMQRHVIVAAPQDKKYIRIRKACAAGGGSNCQHTQVYYCPGACHEIGLSTGQEPVTVPDAGAFTNNNTSVLIADDIDVQDALPVAPPPPPEDMDENEIEQGSTEPTQTDSVDSE